MFELKSYQEKAVQRLTSDVEELLKYPESSVCIFKAPTGSGKTVMTAEFMQRLVTHGNTSTKLSFIWISVNRLHDQSKESLEKYYEDSRVLHCSDFDDLDDRVIGENEILFFNWQSINKKDNIFIRENEQDNNLSIIIQRTKEAGRDIVLIIDESHHTAKADKSREVIGDINPHVTIEVSATPHLTDHNRMIEVNFHDVKEEGMIKTEVQLNHQIDKKIDGKTADEVVLSAALHQREKIRKALKKIKSNVNPLVLIQLPDKRTGVLDRKEDIEKILKNKFKITTTNRKLAIYLSDKSDKINLENIEKPDNETEVLLFKQAIALGWDCPRAAILVLFRDWKSFTFSIQTIGRIMRMPEWKHYDDELLNKGYIFTNVADVNVAEDVAKDYVTVYESQRRNNLYKNIDLNSSYLKKQQERTRLTGEFSKIFLQAAKKMGLQKKVKKKPSQLVTEIIVDGQITKLDQVQLIRGTKELTLPIDEKELQHRFDLYIRGATSPFAPVHSSGRVKAALYKFFETELKISDYEKAQKIILGQENNQLFTDALNNAKEQYQVNVVAKLAKERETEKYIWNVPLHISHNKSYKLINYKKSIMKPHYEKKISSQEEAFTTFLESSKDVEWWFRNGEAQKKFFAIEYRDDKGKKRGFYVDYIVKLKNGRIGLFDPKSGFTANEAKLKAEALHKYIKAQKKKLFGGIFTFRDGSYRYNDSAKYSYDEQQLGSQWKYLDFSK